MENNQRVAHLKYSSFAILWLVMLIFLFEHLIIHCQCQRRFLCFTISYTLDFYFAFEKNYIIIPMSF